MNGKIIIFDGIKYKMILTDHSKQRMLERGISIKYIINSIEYYDKKYQNYGKEIVEKNINNDNIRTVFTLKANNIILITSMKLGK